MKAISIIIIAASLALGSGIVAREYLSPVKLDVATPLPEFILPDVSGKQRNISEWQGKIRIINFWATWCPPCLKEIPEFVDLQDRHSVNGVQFIGVAVDSQESVAEFLTTHKVNYPILIGDIEGIALAQKLGNNVGVVPFTLVVNQQGQIIYQHSGEISKEKIMEIVAPLIKSGVNS